MGMLEEVAMDVENYTIFSLSFKIICVAQQEIHDKI